jgi:hypothetical protein
MNNINNQITLSIVVIIISALIGWYSTVGVKTQLVRLIDIFIYGPFFIWLGFTRAQRDWERVLLFFVGATTITYNLRNYLAIKKNDVKNE